MCEARVFLFLASKSLLKIFQGNSSITRDSGDNILLEFFLPGSANYLKRLLSFL
jgi:hypothetical protein